MELPQEYGAVREVLQRKILSETDGKVLKGWLKLASRSGSIEKFEENM